MRMETALMIGLRMQTETEFPMVRILIMKNLRMAVAGNWEMGAGMKTARVEAAAIKAQDPEKETEARDQAKARNRSIIFKGRERNHPGPYEYV